MELDSGKAILFLGCLSSCSEEGAAGYKAEATNVDPKGQTMRREGDSGGLLC